MENNISLRSSALLSLAFVLVIWSVKLTESLLGVSFHQLGVYPHTFSGLIGIVSAPLIHGSWQHLFGNTLPILLLGTIAIYGYPKSRWWALAVIWMMSGVGVWLFARSNYHIGASGLTHGLFFYLFVGGILRRDKRSSALLMVSFFMYGSMLFTIFPREAGVSFEYHLFGALSGAACAFAFRHWDPKPERKTYSWEDEENSEEDGDDAPFIEQSEPSTRQGAPVQRSLGSDD